MLQTKESTSKMQIEDIFAGIFCIGHKLVGPIIKCFHVLKIHGVCIFNTYFLLDDIACQVYVRYLLIMTNGIIKEYRSWPTFLPALYKLDAFLAKCLADKNSMWCSHFYDLSISVHTIYLCTLYNSGWCTRIFLVFIWWWWNVCVRSGREKSPFVPTKSLWSLCLAIPSYTDFIGWKAHIYLCHEDG